MKPLLVGELNPRGADPRLALYPRTVGCAGWRLCHLVMDLEEREYLRRFDRVNLCSGAWSAAEAREAARRLDVEDRLVVLLGRKACRAFGLDHLPFFRWSGDSSTTYLALPHPSGRCRLWNGGQAYERARVALRAVGVIFVGGARSRSGSQRGGVE